MQDKPRIPIHIFDCGQDSKSSRPIDLDEDKPSSKIEQRSAQNKINAFEAFEARKLETINEIPIETKPPVEDDLDSLVAKLRAPPSGELDAKQQRKAELLLKMNAALRENNKAVIEEQERLNDPNYERKRNKDEYFRKQQQIESELESRGLDKSKKYLF